MAAKVLKDANISEFPVDLHDILKHYPVRMLSYTSFCMGNDMAMEECVSRFGKDGSTSSRNGRYIIVYNEMISPSERIRFTLAHELGHIILGHLKELGLEVMQRLWVEKSLYDVMEDEANCFARNLLCPPQATADLLRLHGLVAVHFDERQSRNVWLKVSSAPCLPDIPESVRDYILVCQAFNVTDKAAKARCHFLKDDLQNLKPEDRTSPSGISHTAQWRCTRCGAPRLEGILYCCQCGARNQFGFARPFSVLPFPENTDPYKMNEDRRLSVCLYCGQAVQDADARFCMMCGRPVVNECTACGHRNNAFARYCEKCGRRTLFLDRELLRPIDAEPTIHEYHQPPDPPEGKYTREKRRDEERAVKLAEREKKWKEYIKNYDEQV